MKVKHSLLASAVSAAILSASAPAFAAPSAKFAATWNTDSPNVVSMAEVTDATSDVLVADWKVGYKLTTIKVPQDKELLVGVSAEIGLTTDTSVKGKNGGSAKAIAGAGGAVLVVAFPAGSLADGKPAHPGPVVLSRRIQELDATLGGVIEECEDTTGGTDEAGLNPGDEGYVDTPDGKITVAIECIVSDEEIGLMLDTLASHHFNFVLSDMDAGEYDIYAVFFTGASAEVDIDETTIIFDDENENTNISASASGKAFVGKTMLTVQQVRAVKGSLADVDIIE
ncbi:MAG TPA: hypothetical protein DCF62_00175 [Porticoccaceae bacterium]|nr:hypothetical protein [Porticoccaceae bacterium]HCO59698.1 hypothetical protein [Porticoccaceae bacterium]